MSDPIDVSRTSWMSRGACRRADPELFFPSASGVGPPGQAERAKAVCARCPVRTDCLAYALVTRQRYGIWGGFTEDERRALTRRQVRVP